MSRFSARHGLGGTAAPIKIRDAAPEEMRSVVLDIAYELGLSPSPMRALLCKLLRKRANPANWSEWPNVACECEDLIQQCEWYEVYDAMEEIFQRFQKSEFYDSKHGPMYKAQCFADEVNRYFHREGIGWQLIDGEIVTRGTEIFESAVRGAAEALESVQRSTARDEFHEALIDLSRRPEPDLTGAIQHAMAALDAWQGTRVGTPKQLLVR